MRLYDVQLKLLSGPVDCLDLSFLFGGWEAGIIFLPRLHHQHFFDAMWPNSVLE